MQAADLRSDETKFNDERVNKARLTERERCAKIGEKWSGADHIRLHAGEMTAQELRSVRAVVRSIVAELREP